MFHDLKGNPTSYNMALKPTRFRYAPAVGLALRYALQPKAH